MISLRLAIPAVLVAAAVAACFTYLLAPRPSVEVEQQRQQPSINAKASSKPTPVNVDQHLNPEEQAAAAFTRASKMILRRLPEAQAAADDNNLPITGRVPLPRRRPVPLP